MFKKLFQMMVAFVLLLSIVSFQNPKKTEAATATTMKTGIIDSTSYANVYKGPGSGYGSTGGKIYKGEIVTVHQTSGGWTYVQSGNNLGWVWGQYVRNSSGVGVTTNTYANLYKGAGKSYGTLGKINQGTTIILFEIKNGWQHLYANGQEAWVWGSFTSAVEGIGTVSTSYVNLYKGPGKSYGTQGSAVKGTTVLTAAIKNGWRHVYVNGDEAWVWDGNLARTDFSQTNPNTITSPSYVNVYNSTGKANGTKGQIENGQSVVLYASFKGWSYVQGENMEGWVWGSFVTPSYQTGKIVNTSYANIYNGAGSSTGAIGRVDFGKSVKVYETKNGWRHIKSGDTTGWVWGEFVVESMSIVSGSKGTNPLAATAYVYKTAGKTFGNIGSIPKGAAVTYFQGKDGWRYVQAGNIQGWVWDEFVNTYQTVDLRKASNVSATVINNYINAYENLTGKVSVIAGKGQTIIDAANKYGINALFLAALTIHESAYGTSNLSYGKDNLFGLKAFNVAPYESAYRFKSFEEGINFEAAYVRSNYIDPSGAYYNGSFLGDKQAGMNVKYSSDPLWGQKIANHMTKMQAYDVNYYSKTKANTTISYTMPAVPNNTDVYPSNILAVVKKGIPLYDAKKGTKVGTLAEGKTFTMLTKSNDFWVKLVSGGKEYWTLFPYSSFTDYVEVYNLIRVERANNASISLYKDSSTTSGSLEKISNNTYMEAILDKDKKPVMDDSKTWYQVKTSSGKTGWVQKTYVKLVLH